MHQYSCNSENTHTSYTVNKHTNIHVHSKHTQTNLHVHTHTHIHTYIHVHTKYAKINKSILFLLILKAILRKSISPYVKQWQHEKFNTITGFFLYLIPGAWKHNFLRRSFTMSKYPVLYAFLGVDKLLKCHPAYK